MQLENLYIQESTEYILQVLKSDLELKGIHRFKDLKQNGKNVQTQCPFLSLLSTHRADRFLLPLRLQEQDRIYSKQTPPIVFTL